MSKITKYIKHLLGIHRFQNRWHKYYHPHKNRRWYLHWVVDFIVLLIIILLVIFNLQMYSQNRNWHDIILNSFGHKNNINNPGILNTKIDVQLTTDNKNINIGSDINYKLKVINNNSFELKNVEAIIDTNIGEATNIQLGDLGSNQTKNIDFTITNQNKESIFKTLVTITYTNNQDNNKGFSVSNELIQKANTIFKIKAFARYYTDEGDQLGLGPVPPQINVPTKYWIIINPITSNNPIADFKLTAKLPKNVSFTGRTSTTAPKNIIYQKNNHQIIWQLDSIIAQKEYFGVAFEVEIIPNESQINHTAPLLKNIRATSIDSITGRVFNLNLGDITTNLRNDKLENSDGIVRY